MSTTDTDLTEKLLQDLDFTPDCDNEVCDNKATHIVHCACGKGKEFVCIACIEKMKAAALADIFTGFLKFSEVKACGHLTHINRCIITPL